MARGSTAIARLDRRREAPTETPARTRTEVSEPGAPPAILPLARIGRYEIEGVLGSGGMAVVYLAHDPALDRAIALKVIRAAGDAHAASRLVREAQALARVVHPNVIHVYEVGREAEHLVYIAMQRIAGVTLADWLRGPRTHRQIVRVFAEAGRGLAAAHAAGLVHRDFKPENVMVGDDGRVRVLDFGLARATDDDAVDATRADRGAIAGATAHGAVMGTPAYMSPEQWRGERPSVRGDQFSFCVALARALSGEHPFGGGARDELREAVLAGRCTLPASIPRRLRAVLRRGLATDPGDRFPSMDAIVAALTRRPRWPLAALAAGIAGAGIAAAVALGSPGAPESTTTAYVAATPITSRGDLGVAAMSPDGTQLAYVTRDALVVQPMLPGADPHELARGRFSHYFLSWSPDGRKLATVGTLRDATGPGGLLIADVRSGETVRVGPNLGFVALLARGELAAAHSSAQAVAFYSLADLRRPLRTCPLPKPFAGVRSLRYEPDTDAVLVQLDLSDSESTIVRIDPRCERIETAVRPIRALSFVGRRDDGTILAHLFSTNSLVEIGPDGTPTAAQHVIQSNEYEALGFDREHRLAHLDRSTRWQLLEVADGAQRILRSGTDQSRFAIAPDGVTVAQVEGVYRRGILKLGRLDRPSRRFRTITKGVKRTAWSPDGERLAVLTQDRSGYALAIWDPATGTMSRRRPLPIRYDVGMTWVDDRRVAFGVAHEYQGFWWIDPASGATGTLAVGDGEQTFSLQRAHHDARLAFVTGDAREIRVWTFAPGERAHLAAAIPVTATRTSRRGCVRWADDDRSLLVFDGLSGDMWSVDLGDGRVERLPDAPLPRAGSSAELTNVFDLGDRVLFESFTRSADVFLSAPL